MNTLVNQDENEIRQITDDTKEEVEFIREKLYTNQAWLEKGILAIDARQTPDEQDRGITAYQNGRGWNSSDASTGGYMAQYIRDCRRPLGQKLSGKWVDRARKMMGKYARQLLRIVRKED